MTDPIKEIKKERLNKITETTSNILGKFTNDNIVKGNIILFLHWTLMIISTLFIVILPINKINIIILIIIVILHNVINIYYGKLTSCLFVKFERHFYNDQSWYGPTTFILKLLGINNKENHCYIQLFNLSGWIILYTYYLYRLYNLYLFDKEKKD